MQGMRLPQILAATPMVPRACADNWEQRHAPLMRAQPRAKRHGEAGGT
jgi:hypothetical protein